MAEKYLAKERKAYHMGRAYAMAKAGKRVPCPDEKTKKSFRVGVNAVRGKKRGRKSVLYVSGTPFYIVDDNGVVLKVFNGGNS